VELRVEGMWVAQAVSQRRRAVRLVSSSTARLPAYAHSLARGLPGRGAVPRLTWNLQGFKHHIGFKSKGSRLVWHSRAFSIQGLSFIMQSSGV
jgi:hypothetical protein